jgi:serine/threonine protein kinase
MFREDALNEIRILASIKHRNIIRYCDAFTEKDNLYIVMEFAEHGDVGRQVGLPLSCNAYLPYYGHSRRFVCFPRAD